VALNIDSVNALVQDTLMKVLVNNIFDDNVFAPRALGKAETHDATKLIQAPLEYAQNTANGMIGKLGKMNLDVPDPLTGAVYTPITAYQTLSIAWEDQLEWTSDLAVKNGVNALMKNAEESFKFLFSSKMYQPATSKGTNDIHPLDELISKSVNAGGIDYSTNSWWNSKVLTTTDFGSTDLTDIDVLTDPSSAGFIEKILRKLVSQTKFGGKSISVMITSQHLFDIMDEVASATIDRPVSIKKSGSAVERMGSMGFDAMQFRNVPIIADDELFNAQSDFAGTASDNGRIYGIAEDTLKFAVNARGNMKYKPFAEPIGQNSSTAKILWRGNQIVTNRRRQGVVTGLLSEY
jgi:hypothetical protein